MFHVNQQEAGRWADAMASVSGGVSSILTLMGPDALLPLACGLAPFQASPLLFSPEAKMFGFCGKNASCRWNPFQMFRESADV